MAKTKMKSIRELNEKDLKDRLQQARSELSKLKADASKGTLRKESGKLKPVRRSIARMMTRLNEMDKK